MYLRVPHLFVISTYLYTVYVVYSLLSRINELILKYLGFFKFYIFCLNRKFLLFFGSDELKFKMYFSTVLLLFLISKFTYAANSPPRQQRMRRQQTISTAEQQTQWILFNRPFSDAKALLQRATADFSIRCSYKIQIKIFSILYLLKLRDPDSKLIIN